MGSDMGQAALQEELTPQSPEEAFNKRFSPVVPHVVGACFIITHPNTACLEDL
jgi:hypothetical protein